MTTEVKFKKWEVALSALGALLLIGPLLATLLQIPVRKYLFDLSDDSENPKMGFLYSTTGELKRSSAGNRAFEPISSGATLFQDDLVVTGKETSALIQLDEGGQVEVGPNTMLRLALQPELSLGGVRRYEKLEVVTGTVTAKAPKRKIIVRAQDQVLTLAPKTGQKLQVIPTEGSTKRRAIVSKPVEIIPEQLQKLVKPPEPAPLPKPQPTTPRTLLLPPSPRAILPSASPSPSPTPSEIPSPSPLPSPSPVPKPPKVTTPPLPKQVTLLGVLVGGEKRTSNRLNGELLKQLAVELRWEAIPTAQSYEIAIQGNSPKSPRFRRSVPVPSILVQNANVFGNEFTYSVTAVTAEGKKIKSKPEKFSMTFLPPLPVMPRHLAQIRLAELKKDQGNLLITWEKTNFTQRYQIEISKTPGFERPVIRQTLPENFYTFKKPAVGSYWWRTRSFSDTQSSSMSETARFEIVP